MHRDVWPAAGGVTGVDAAAAMTVPSPPPVHDGMIGDIRAVLADCGGLATDPAVLAPDDDLYGAGLTSHGCVGLMLGLEERFEVEFPETLLNRRTFESIVAIRDAVRGLIEGAGA